MFLQDTYYESDFEEEDDESFRLPKIVSNQYIPQLFSKHLYNIYIYIYIYNIYIYIYIYILYI